MTTPPQQTQDYEHEYRAANGWPARCRIRVFEANPTANDDSPPPIVIVSELPLAEYDGPSVTNNIEQICAEVLVRFALPTHETVLFEHYPSQALVREEERFDLLAFEQRDPELRVVAPGRSIMQLGMVSWRREDKAYVERAIGQPLGP